MVKRGGFLWAIWATIFSGIAATTIFLVKKQTSSTKVSLLSSLIFLWMALDFWLFSFIYFFGQVNLGVCLIHKNKKTGKVPLLARIIHFPYLKAVYLIWLWKKNYRSEDPYAKVADGIYVGKYPRDYPENFPDDATIVADLTVEFSAPAKMVHNLGYYCYPCLDFVLSEEVVMLAELAIELAKKRQDQIYIHCANGHGRSATLAAMLLVIRGSCPTLEAAAVVMKKKRSTIKLNLHQIKVAEAALRYVNPDDFNRRKQMVANATMLSTFASV